MKKKLTEIPSCSTSHGIGEKRVLLIKGETLTSITQIAITKLKVGEESEMHKHPTMEEYFLFRKGKSILSINNQQLICEADDFVRIQANTPHSIKAITDLEVLTIGCALDPNKNNIKTS